MVTPAYEKYVFLRYILGNTASALGIFSRVLPYLSAFGEGFLIGLCTLFILVLAVSMQISITVISIIGALIWGLIAWLPYPFAVGVGTALEKLSKTLSELVALVVVFVHRGKVWVPPLVELVSTILGEPHVLTALTSIILGLGLVASALAPVYTVRPPRHAIPLPIWVFTGILGYLAAVGLFTQLPIVDTIYTLFRLGLSTLAVEIALAVPNMIAWAFTTWISSLGAEFYGLIWTMASTVILGDAEAVARAIAYVIAVVLIVAAILVYFSAISLVPAVFTQALVATFHALGRRGVQSPGGAFFCGILMSIFFAGLMFALLLFGVLLIVFAAIMILLLVEQFFVVQGLIGIVKALSPFQAIKTLTSNDLPAVFIGNILALLVYELVRMAWNGILRAARGFGSVSPEICLGKAFLVLLLTIMLLTGAPGANLVAWVYTIFIPTGIMVMIVLSAITGPPTRARGATSAANMLLYGITFMIFMGFLGAALFGLFGKNLVVSFTGLGNTMSKTVPHITAITRQTVFRVEDALNMLTSYTSSTDVSRIATTAVPLIAATALVFPIDRELETSKLMLQTHCTFTYKVYEAVGEDYNEYFRVKYQVYEAARRGQEYCTVPGHGTVRCDEAMRRFGQEYYCDFIYVKWSTS